MKPWSYKPYGKPKRTLRTREDLIRIIRKQRRQIYDLEAEVARLKNLPPPPKLLSTNKRKSPHTSGKMPPIPAYPPHFRQTQTRKSR